MRQWSRPCNITPKVGSSGNSHVCLLLLTLNSHFVILSCISIRLSETVHVCDLSRYANRGAQCCGVTGYYNQFITVNLLLFAVSISQSLSCLKFSWNQENRKCENLVSSRDKLRRMIWQRMKGDEWVCRPVVARLMRKWERVCLCQGGQVMEGGMLTGMLIYENKQEERKT